MEKGNDRQSAFLIEIIVVRQISHEMGHVYHSFAAERRTVDTWASTAPANLTHGQYVSMPSLRIPCFPSSSVDWNSRPTIWQSDKKHTGKRNPHPSDDFLRIYWYTTTIAHRGREPVLAESRFSSFYLWRPGFSNRSILHKWIKISTTTLGSFSLGLFGWTIEVVQNEKDSVDKDKKNQSTVSSLTIWDYWFFSLL